MIGYEKKTSAKFINKPPAFVYWCTINTQFGAMISGMTKSGEICRLGFLRGQTPKDILKKWKKKWPRTIFIKNNDEVRMTIRRIFLPGNNSRRQKVKIVLVGTAFQHCVWKSLFAIQAGQTESYSDLAKRIGKPNAVRAVGNALGANPIPVLVPCHRVIAENGTLGGYSGGKAMKKKLLASENIVISNS